jgi:hypothetical protein
MALGRSTQIADETTPAKTQSAPSWEKKKIFYFASWRLGAIYFVEVVPFGMQKVRI